MSHRNKAIHDFSSQSTSGGSQRAQPTQPKSSKRASKQTTQTATQQEEQQQPNNSENDSEFANDETELLIGNCIRYILMKEYTRSVIKQIDISKHLCENHILKRNAIGYILKEAKKRLFDLFGLQMVELKESNSYILNNIYNLGEVCLYENEEIQANHCNDSSGDIDIPETSVDDTHDGSSIEDGGSDSGSNANLSDDEDLNVLNSLNYDEFIDICKKPLLLTILSLIFMNEYPLPEKELFLLIKELGINLEDKIETRHDATKVSIKKLILEEFCRKGYLKRSKVPNQDSSDEILYEFSWGQRAGLEFKKSDILEFVKDIYPSGDLALWNRYNKRAIEEDEIRYRQIFGIQTGDSSENPQPESSVSDEIGNGSGQSNRTQATRAAAAATTSNRKTRSRDLDANNESDHELDLVEIDENEVISQINQSLQLRRSSRRSQVLSPGKKSNKVSKAKTTKESSKNSSSNDVKTAKKVNKKAAAKSSGTRKRVTVIESEEDDDEE